MHLLCKAVSAIAHAGGSFEAAAEPVTLTFEDIASKKQFTQEVKAPVTALGGGQAAPMQHNRH